MSEQFPATGENIDNSGSLLRPLRIGLTCLVAAGLTMAGCGSSPNHNTGPKAIDFITDPGLVTPSQAALCVTSAEPITVVQVTPEPIAEQTLPQLSGIVVKDVSSCANDPDSKFTFEKLPALIPTKNLLEIDFNAVENSTGTHGISGFEMTYYTTNSQQLHQEFVEGSPELEFVIRPDITTASK